MLIALSSKTYRTWIIIIVFGIIIIIIIIILFGWLVFIIRFFVKHWVSWTT